VNGYVMRALGPVLIVAALAILGARLEGGHRKSHTAVNTSDVTRTAVGDVTYVCPMDPDVRSRRPGTCQRCGMKLQAGVPDPAEFHLDLTVRPQRPEVAQRTSLTFAIHDPWKDRLVKAFSIVHEKLFHAFIVSQDLEFFEHGHPTPIGDGTFEYLTRLPSPGMYRILGDFYPEGATPQLITETVFVPGAESESPTLVRDYSEKKGGNMRVALETIPDQPVAGARTQMRFTLDAGGLEKYLGAWAHMLIASDDLIDMMHEHPARADGGPRVEFDIVFPRARSFRVWVQFQRGAVVNTVHFDVPVTTQ
jgi:Heavy metal binding domain